MADIFLSYASKDRDRVRSLAHALEAAGLSVWWDRRLDPGTSFDREIEKQLADASCVMVVWSSNSVESDWVREEADEGMRRNVLIPVQIDEGQLPLGFRRTHAAQLIGWPDKDHDLEGLIRRVADLIAKGVVPSEKVPEKKWHVYAAVVALLAVTGLAGFYYRDDLMLAMLLNAPALFVGNPVDQELGFATSSDGTRIAFATSGSGPPIVHVLTVSTHLELGLNSPAYDNDGLVVMSSRDHLFVRYDGRGTGLSDRAVVDFSLAARVADLEAVVDALDLERFAVLGVSAGGQPAVAYTAKHPERVTRLVLAAAFVSADDVSPQTLALTKRMIDLFQVGWQRPEVTDMWANLLLAPQGNELSRRLVGEMMRRANDGPVMADFLRSLLLTDVRHEAELISVPTLVLQARDDAMIPLDAGRGLASRIPGAKLEIVDGGHLAGSASTASTRRRALQFLENGR